MASCKHASSQPRLSWKGPLVVDLHVIHSEGRAIVHPYVLCICPNPLNSAGVQATRYEKIPKPPEFTFLLRDHAFACAKAARHVTHDHAADTHTTAEWVHCGDTGTVRAQPPPLVKPGRWSRGGQCPPSQSAVDKPHQKLWSVSKRTRVRGHSARAPAAGTQPDPVGLTQPRVGAESYRKMATRDERSEHNSERNCDIYCALAKYDRAVSRYFVSAKFRELQNGIRKCITPHGVTKHCWGAQWWGSRPPPPKQGGMAEDAFGTGPLPQILPCAGRVLCRFSHPKSRSTSTPQPSRRAPAPGTLEPDRRRRTPNERVPAIPGARFRGRWPVAAHMRSGSAPALLWKGPCRAADAEPLRRRQRGGDGHHPPCGLAAGGGGVAIKLCRWRDEMDARVLYFVPASRPPKSGAS
eukprot:gene10778-biopygen6313